MSSKKRKKKNNNIEELKESRSGGQNALRGYTYQLLYSCYLILHTVDCNTSLQLEGIEDIDSINQRDENNYITSIQLKYSTKKQDASFMVDVLENFLEAYLLEKKRNFKLVYDFKVANGNLKKLFEYNLDDVSHDYWLNVVYKIKLNNPSWNWSEFNFERFILSLSFEKIEKATLENDVEKAIIGLYEIDTDNISLFANALQVFCLKKMEQREYVVKEDIDGLIQRVKEDISKGSQNPAHSWIRKINYDRSSCQTNSYFYEGKKATPADIANGIPIKREKLENRIKESIHKNTVTIIKASSGQGKTTLALQATYSLCNEYKPYQLLCCDDTKEIGNTIQFFKSRIQLGEIVLIIIDNLDCRFRNWNNLVQLLQSELQVHFKLLITTRETDWYNYCGDLSKVKSIEIIKPTLEEKEAMEIFNLFKAANQLHPQMTNWKSAWNMIAERQLLIEYVYLLTHGEMLSERIASQLFEIGNADDGRAKCDILRKVCFADSCGIRLSVSNIQKSLTCDYHSDFGELIKSMESEFLVHIDSNEGFVEGLHPIRSRHVVDKLHEILPIDDTIVSVIELAEKTDLPLLFSHLPKLNINKEKLSDRIIELLWDEENLLFYIYAIEGLFSGSVMQYYLENKDAFDDANHHNGLMFFSIEKCPFVSMPKFKVEMNTLENMRELFPSNTNIEYLCKLRDNTPTINLQDTFVYIFCKQLYMRIQALDINNIKDIMSYATIAEYLYCVDSELNLSSKIDLEYIWKNPENISLECIASLMFMSYCGNEQKYLEFVDNNLNHILRFLKEKTKSHSLYVDSNDNSIHVEYIAELADAENAAEQSVSRLKSICKVLPIYELYCSNSLKPTVDFLANYNIPDDAQKKMSIQTLVETFHQSFNSLWIKTIRSQYEFDTATEWLCDWIAIREHICLLADKYCSCIYRLLEGRSLGNLAKEIDQLHLEYAKMTTGEKLYPKQDRPFGEKNPIPEGLSKNNGYFQHMQNVSTQFIYLLSGDEQKQSTLLYNIKMANSNLMKMQNFFTEIITTPKLEKKQLALCSKETQIMDKLVMCCEYYIDFTPSKYFNKFYIQKWYSNKCQDERRMAEDKLALLKKQGTIYYPEKTYEDGILSYYPIIVEHIDVKSAKAMEELFMNILPFSGTSYDYLVIIFIGDSGKVETNALQFNREKLVDAINVTAIESDAASSILSCFYPVVVTNQMLDCFCGKYEIPKTTASEENSLPIVEIAEALWDYSKVEELLTDPEESLYLIDELQRIKSNIDEKISILKGRLSVNDYNWVEKQCEDVFAGGKYNDERFNNMIEYFMKV